MKEFWNVIQAIFAAVGGWLGYFWVEMMVCYMHFWLLWCWITSQESCARWQIRSCRAPWASRGSAGKF